MRSSRKVITHARQYGEAGAEEIDGELVRARREEINAGVNIAVGKVEEIYMPPLQVADPSRAGRVGLYDAVTADPVNAALEAELADVAQAYASVAHNQGGQFYDQPIA